MTETPQDPAPTFGEIFHGEWAAAQRRFMHEWSAWADLSPTEQESIRAGARAVADVAIRRRIDELDAQAEPKAATVIGPSGIDQLLKLAGHFEARGRKYAAAAQENAADHDSARVQTAIGASYRKCAGQLRDVIGDLASPTAEDFDRAAEEIARRDQAAKALVVVDEHGRKQQYSAPGLAVSPDGTLALGTLVTDCLGQYLVDPVAAFARGDWRRVFEDTAETEASAYYRHQLGIAQQALQRVTEAGSLEAARQDAETGLAAIGAGQ